MVYDYLLENDIANERISYQGYGNWEMRFPKAISEEQQALNRRVEIRVLEGGCQ
jgi:outer membrane protein OmpA-like peptidoglycan-associated protein